jgi:YHS domain-containing protein
MLLSISYKSPEVGIMRHCTLAVLLLLSSSGAHAQSARTVEALDGLDPVLLIQGKETQGKPSLAVIHGRFSYLFSSAETKAAFEKDPAKYEIQLGGMCARMGKTAGGNPADFLVHDGKIYIFGSDDCHRKFQAAPQKFIAPPVKPLPTSRTAATRGRQLVDQVVKSFGTAQRIDALTSYVETIGQTQKRQEVDVPVVLKTSWLFPDYTKQERTMTLQGKTMGSTTILAPEGMWFVTQSGQAYPSPSAARASLEQDFGRHPIALLRARRDPNVKLAAIGPATIDGKTVEQVRIVRGGVDVIMNVDWAGRLHSVSFQDRNIDGEYGTYALLYSDFKDVKGLTLPFTVRGQFNGQPDPSQTWTVESITLDAPLDKSAFAPKK